jgi:hypothetical protein
VAVLMRESSVGMPAVAPTIGPRDAADTIDAERHRP